MKKIKHSKYRNAGFLYELLVRQVTADIINNVDTPVSERILKKYFSPTTELGKELRLYKTFLKEKYKSDAMGANFIEAVLKTHSKLPRKSLLEQKYNLVKEIRQHYNINEFFRSPINDYKVLASIYTLFEDNLSSEKHDPFDIARSKNTVLEHICTPRILKPSAKVLNEYEKQERDLQLLTYKLLVDRFNKKYSSKLCSRQKKLLKEYINNLTNTNSLKEHTDKEIPWVLNKLTMLYGTVDDDVSKIKMKEVMKQIGGLTKKKQLNESHITSLMLAYELIQEIRRVTETRQETS